MLVLPIQHCFWISDAFEVQRLIAENITPFHRPGPTRVQPEDATSARENDSTFIHCQVALAATLSPFLARCLDDLRCVLVR